MRTHLEDRRAIQMSSLPFLVTVSHGTQSLLSLLDWLVREFPGSTSPHLPVLGLDTCAMPGFDMDAGDWNSGPQAPVAIALTEPSPQAQ